MSGHNKWSSIKHKKAAVDAKKGKIFSRLSKELTLAAKTGGKDADTNPRLRSAISAAKSENMPNENIDRAIKKGTGELGGAILEELSYEGYAVGGVAVVVDCLSDNRNRIAADIRSIFSKANGSLANSGAVSWIFHRKTRFLIEGPLADEEKLMELCFDSGAELDDVTVSEGIAEIIAPPEAFGDIVQALENGKANVKESGIVRIPENEVSITDVSIARQVLRLLDLIEEYDDVQNVYSNANFDDDVLEKLSSE